MSYPKAIKDLGEPWASIYGAKDPIQFIDLLCVSSYFAGQFDNKMPVSQTRTVFLEWLERKAPPRITVLAPSEPSSKKRSK